MVSFIKFISFRLKQMPYGLRSVTRVCLLFTVFLPLSLLPFGDHFIGGHRVSFGEFWIRGGGVFFFSLGVFFALIAYGFLHATRWSRLLCILPPLVYGVYFAFNRNVLVGVFQALVFEFIIVWYLFWKSTVKDYYKCQVLN